ncbi:MAG: hypothetical protein RR231_09240 [Acinetobacter sp.]
MKSEFERWIGDVWLSDAEWDESKNTYSDSRIHCMWSAWQHQQTKVDELQSMFVEQARTASNQQAKIDELQKRLDAAQKVADKMVKGTVSVSMFAYELEQALKGGEA